MSAKLSAPTVMVIAALIFVAGPPPIRGQAKVSAGYDLFATDPDTTDLLGVPFAGDAGAKPTFDFVAPPASANRRRAVGDTDTIVHRMETASVDTIPGTAEPIAIELVMLRLVSKVEFDLDADGVSDGKVFVTLQKDRDPAGEVRRNFDHLPGDADTPPAPPGFTVEQVRPGLRSFGEMTITFGSAAGGTFDSRLLIFADLRLGSAAGPIVCGETAGLPPCADLDAGLGLASQSSFWSRDPLPGSITIRGVNFSLAAPDRNDPVDTSIDFRAGVDPMASKTVCVEHGGHPDPGGAPTNHGTCFTPCTTGTIAADSCRNSTDDDCNGTIDDCDEDQFGPFVVAPASQTFECPQQEADLGPPVAGFATGTDNCFPATLRQENIFFTDFRAAGCGDTFVLDRVWSARDDCGNEAAMPDLQQIFVVDETHPVITFCPLDTTILWTADSSPATLGSATATDTCGDVGIDFADVAVAGVCRSQEITRTWTATDDCGNDTPCLQLISVRGPRDSILDLTNLLSGLDLPNGCRNGLTATLAAAERSVCRSNPGSANAAAGQLGAFLNQLDARACARALEPADAEALRAAAEAIIAAIEIQDLDGAPLCPDVCGGSGGNGGGNGGGWR